MIGIYHLEVVIENFNGFIHANRKIYSKLTMLWLATFRRTKKSVYAFDTEQKTMIPINMEVRESIFWESMVSFAGSALP